MQEKQCYSKFQSPELELNGDSQLIVGTVSFFFLRDAVYEWLKKGKLSTFYFKNNIKKKFRTFCTSLKACF